MSSRRTPGPIATNASCRWDVASASRNMDIGGYGSRIALAEPVTGRAFARPVGSLVRDDMGFAPEFSISFSNSKFKTCLRDPAALIARGFAKTVRPGNRGRRECRARDAPAASCVKKQTHERSHHGHTGNHPAFPAQWFYGLLRALPGDHACLTPSPARLHADLTPALGRQNHTTWPYASRPRSSRAPPTSIASRPAFVTIASRPSCGTGRGESVN
jgi:hypothetical protein